MILVKDGRVIDPARGIDDVLDLVIDGGKIAKIGKYQRSEGYKRIIEAKGCVVAPGLVDVHVHFRDPGFTYKEDIESGAASAAVCRGANWWTWRSLPPAGLRASPTMASR
ncbi:hypothetical protein [Senegalimassilia anaerobia]